MRNIFDSWQVYSPSMSARHQEWGLRKELNSRVLVVEDDLELAGLVAAVLRETGCGVTHAGSISAARHRIESESWDLLVLDAQLPDGDGFEFCRQLRRDRVPTSVLFMTARASDSDRIAGLELGADDYLTKPFNLRELSLRCSNLLRRWTDSRSSSTSPRERIVCGDIAIEPAQRRAFLGANPITLTPREFDLLAHLATHTDRVFSRSELLNAVWGPRFEGFDHTVNSHINRLRLKLEADPRRPQRLVTVWGTGYRLAAARTRIENAP